MESSGQCRACLRPKLSNAPKASARVSSGVAGRATSLTACFARSINLSARPDATACKTFPRTKSFRAQIVDALGDGEKSRNRPVPPKRFVQTVGWCGKIHSSHGRRRQPVRRRGAPGRKLHVSELPWKKSLTPFVGLNKTGPPDVRLRPMTGKNHAAGRPRREGTGLSHLVSGRWTPGRLPFPAKLAD